MACCAILRRVVFHPSSDPCSDQLLSGVVVPLSFADSSGSSVFRPFRPGMLRHAALCRAMPWPCLGLGAFDGSLGCCCCGLRVFAPSSVGCSACYHAATRCALPRCVVPRASASRDSASHSSALRHATPCCALARRAAPRRASPRCSMPCCALLRHAMFLAFCLVFPFLLGCSFSALGLLVLCCGCLGRTPSPSVLVVFRPRLVL